MVQVAVVPVVTDLMVATGTQVMVAMEGLISMELLEQEEDLVVVLQLGMEAGRLTLGEEVLGAVTL
jgi:hypothetical protein